MTPPARYLVRLIPFHHGYAHVPDARPVRDSSDPKLCRSDRCSRRAAVRWLGWADGIGDGASFLCAWPTAVRLAVASSKGLEPGLSFCSRSAMQGTTAATPGTLRVTNKRCLWETKNRRFDPRFSVSIGSIHLSPVVYVLRRSSASSSHPRRNASAGMLDRYGLMSRIGVPSSMSTPWT